MQISCRRKQLTLTEAERKDSQVSIKIFLAVPSEDAVRNALEICEYPISF
jgi:hypothetical protein